MEPCVVNLVSSIKWRTLGLIKWWKSRSRNRRKGRDGTGRVKSTGDISKGRDVKHASGKLAPPYRRGESRDTYNEISAAK